MLVELVDSLKASSNISFGDNSKGKVLGLGKVVISNDSSLANVMLVQSLHYNLLSTIQLARAGYDSHFGEFHVTVFKRSNLKVVFVGHVEDNLYVVDFSKQKTHLATCLNGQGRRGVAMEPTASPRWHDKFRISLKGGAHSWTNQCVLYQISSL